MVTEHIQEPPASATASSAATPTGRWRRPLPMAMLAGVLVLAVAFAPSLWRMVWPNPALPIVDAPWQVELRSDGGTRVFGLELPGTTLADARRRWGADLAVAVMARRGEAGALEAYVERHSAGGIEGRLVLAWAAAEADILRWRGRIEAERLDGGTLRHALDAAALDEAGDVSLVGVTFVANAALTMDMVRGRFGEPAEHVDVARGATTWLYPSIGLAVSIDPDGKDLLQYVAPADFEARLRAPLRR